MLIKYRLKSAWNLNLKEGPVTLLLLTAIGYFFILVLFGFNNCFSAKQFFEFSENEVKKGEIHFKLSF